MSSDSIKAYDLPERVRRYDADMDVMHPLRWKMIAVALEVLPFSRSTDLRILDLGIGTGVFAQQLLKEFPSAQVLGVDGSEAILEIATARLSRYSNRLRLEAHDFRKLPRGLLDESTLDLAVSSYALHHLNKDEKSDVVRQVVGALKTGGWFVNADIVIAESPCIENRFQDLRVKGIVARAEGDERFRDEPVTRQYLDDMEKKEQDQPQRLAVDLQIFREAGLDAEVFWREYREVVVGGPKRA
ncbi:MAG: methyltransferase domain-containing protein [Gammaproteobacteria bacterium]|nr:methyltransferase domain-containing protein [Gammaproteobacteria bacterium]